MVFFFIRSSSSSSQVSMIILYRVSNQIFYPSVHLAFLQQSINKIKRKTLFIDKARSKSPYKRKQRVYTQEACSKRYRERLASWKSISTVWGEACVFIEKSCIPFIQSFLLSGFFTNVQMVCSGSVDGYLCSLYSYCLAAYYPSGVLKSRLSHSEDLDID